MNIQVIERAGKPEWAVLPYDEYLALVEQIEMLQDIRDVERIKARLESGEEELLPSELVFALLEGGNPLRLWREYRNLTQAQLAALAGISVPYLSQIETGKRDPSTRTLAALAQALHVAVDDLIVSD
jgi:DNA-binding XRE family transcriptional regulator